MVSFAFFLSVFFQKSHSATVTGYLFVFGSGLLAGQLGASFIRAEDTSELVIFVFSIFPPFTLYRGLSALGVGVSFERTGLTWDIINENYVRMGEVWLYMVLLTIIFLLLAVYLESVLPAGYGVKKHPLFCCGKSYDDPNAKSDIGRNRDAEVCVVTRVCFDGMGVYGRDPSLLCRPAFACFA